jgi:phosphoribosylformylglycinamidine cyclo-ligase
MYDTTKPYKKQIAEHVQRTWKTPFVVVKDWRLKKLFGDKEEFHHSDRIGTKGIFHWNKRTLHGAVLDALAMNLNDLAMVGVRPYAVIDHILLPADDHEAIVALIEHLSDECVKRQIAITGGETAIHNNITGLEISMTVLGFVERVIEGKFRPGDLLIGIESSGVHSNGFTRLREVFGEGVGERPEVTEPTIIYNDSIMRLIEMGVDISGMMHITGGAYTKLKGLTGESVNVVVHRGHSLRPHPIFHELQERGVTDREMYKTFNCGVGFVIGVAPEDVDRTLETLAMKNQTDVIGKVYDGSGRVIVHSMLSKESIDY